ncbi:MAG: MucR family transcriptional regulator [Hyphomicrobiales bacterium]|jgi:predicted transcriptional regulator
MPETRDLTSLAAGIVSAYVSRNAVPVSELPNLLRTVREGLAVLDAPAEPVAESITPAEIRKSVRPDAIVSFIDGRRYKSLKRHLRAHGMEPSDYRARYGLPADYPMVCPSYSAVRSAISKQIGLGSLGGPKPRAQRQAAE